MDNFWQDKFIRLRAVELNDWKFFFEHDKDVEFSRYTDEVLFPDPIESWLAQRAPDVGNSTPFSGRSLRPNFFSSGWLNHPPALVQVTQSANSFI